MREHKYRAWHKDWQSMYRVRKWELTPDGAVHLVTDKYPTTGITEADHCIFMQYTGLKDKNGKEDYESDILVIPDTYKDVLLDDGSGPTEPANHLAEIVFKNGSFGVEITKGGDDFSKGFWSFERIEHETGLKSTDIENIGNIYENPELVSP